uniref:Ubiquitin-like domain-containing protein n=1 Tax=Oncorhynchus mykiss TaxID=8022 RepID=A0A8K9UWA0_ONCMY
MDLTITLLNGKKHSLSVHTGNVVSLINQHFEVPIAMQKLKRSNVCVRITKPATIQISLNNVKPYDVMPAETVPQFKIKVYHVEQVPVDRQILLFGGRHNIFLTLRLSGG